jgi:hypothetical protein
MADPAPPSPDRRGAIALGCVVAGVAAMTGGAFLLGGLALALLLGGLLLLVLGVLLAWQ